MGDLPVKELGNQTPLEFAETPHMDLLARKGQTGLMYTVRKGISPESDVAVISILGYDPFKYHAGRGPIEAYGAGIKVNDGDLALRCNFATLGRGKEIIDRRAGRDLTTEEAKILAEALNKEVKLESYPAEFEFRDTLGHRGVLVIRSKKKPLSGQITNTDPAYERIEGLGVANAEAKMLLKKSEPLNNTEAAKISAMLVNEFTEKSHLILDKHEINLRRVTNGKLSANLILTRDAGDRLPQLYSINEKYGVRFACFADMTVERGISKLVGMDLIDLPPPSGDLRKDYMLRANKLSEMLPLYDSFYIHIKGPDEPGHDGECLLKAQSIAIVDKYFLEHLLPKIELEKCLLCIASDHSTPCELRAHSDDPVPLLISGDKIEGDGAKKFSEKECRKGSLGILKHGTELMPILTRLLGKTS